MTLSKASLGAALAGHLNAGDPGVVETLEIWAAAAGFVERLLPGTCPDDGEVFDDPNPDYSERSLEVVICSTCHGSGQVWDEGLVEAVAEALHDAPYEGCDNYQQMQVRAVLAALAAEVGK